MIEMNLTREEAIERLVMRSNSQENVLSNANDDFLALMIEDLLNLQPGSVEIVSELESKIRKYEKE